VKFIDFFSGIGGFRIGMEAAGHECVGFCEADKYAVASYTSMHLITDEQREYLATLPFRQRQKEILKEEYRNGEWYSNDITKLRGEGMPRADCWCFGAPCQSFSVAGRRAGLDGQSGLVREVFRILREIPEEDRPEWLMYENVKGMFSSNRGLDYLAILTEMDECGYDCQWETFNSKYCGVPQNRERVYTLGHLRTMGRVQVFPIQNSDGEGSFPEINIIAHRDGYRRNTQTFDQSGITETFSASQGGGRCHHVAIPVSFCNAEVLSEIDEAHCLSALGATKEGLHTHQTMNRVLIPVNCNRKDGMSDEVKCGGTLMARDYKGIGNQDMTAVVVPVLTPERITKRQNGRRFKENGDPAFTLTAQDRHGVAIGITSATLVDGDPSTHDGVYADLGDGCVVYAVWNDRYESYIAIRRLTPKECFRLQGFSDEYYERAAMVNSDTQLYKQAGNAVTTTVVYEVAKNLRRGDVI